MADDKSLKEPVTHFDILNGKIDSVKETLNDKIDNVKDCLLYTSDAADD